MKIRTALTTLILTASLFTVVANAKEISRSRTRRWFMS
jgi:hypothetical protein